MNFEYFEQEILKLAFETDIKITVATVAYYFNIPSREATELLSQLVDDGLLELDSDRQGNFFYRVYQSGDSRDEALLKASLSSDASESSVPPPVARRGSLDQAPYEPTGKVDSQSHEKASSEKPSPAPSSLPQSQGPVPYPATHPANQGGYTETRQFHATEQPSYPPNTRGPMPSVQNGQQPQWFRPPSPAPHAPHAYGYEETPNARTQPFVNPHGPQSYPPNDTYEASFNGYSVGSGHAAQHMGAQQGPQVVALEMGATCEEKGRGTRPVYPRSSAGLVPTTRYNDKLSNYEPRAYDDELEAYANNAAHSPLLAGMLSLFLPGAGQIYNGNFEKGVVMMVVTFFGWLFFFGWMFHLWSIFDAVLVADKIRKEERAIFDAKLQASQKALPYYPSALPNPHATSYSHTMSQPQAWPHGSSTRR